MRLCAEVQLVRFGGLGIGPYVGDIYNARYGDMPYTTRDYRSLTNTYIGGLATSMTWD